MKLKNRHWYQRGEKYLRAKFDIKVILGAADLKFQLQSKTKDVLSKDHDEIQVKWELPRQNSADDGRWSGSAVQVEIKANGGIGADGVVL